MHPDMNQKEIVRWRVSLDKTRCCRLMGMYPVRTYRLERKPQGNAVTQLEETCPHENESASEKKP
ncbi:hypothetical protein M514_01925 [Trichuris suis]|uniref:Uncharacterized protein n=1 Tax=Trichuris suis TaxID=68888 RepID=A0A085NJB2_9BILA|nr:hypothetical protein M513_01925 [Trichuris suis]KFD69558.1 hypothetical protein M514_01925 [Trichuris suis]